MYEADGLTSKYNCSSMILSASAHGRLENFSNDSQHESRVPITLETPSKPLVALISLLPSHREILPHPTLGYIFA